MRCIITGGSGFLGQHLCRALTRAGYEILNIDLRNNTEFPTVVADIRDSAAMLEHIKNADAVFHLASLIEAGESVKFPQKFVDSNISGSVNVLEAMRVNNVPIFIFSSSAAVYGEPQHVPIVEDQRTIPINPYGMTKLAMEGLVSSYVASFGFTGVALRYFNLYGPGENHEPETHAIPRFIKQIDSGEEVTVWGEGQHERDYIYITDVVEAHLAALNLALQKPKEYHYFNLSTEQPTSVKSLVEKISQILQKPAQIHNFPNRPGDPLVLVADASKAKTQLGWQAKTNLDQGLDQTIAYFLEKWTHEK